MVRGGCLVILVVVAVIPESNACTGTWKIKNGRKVLECQPHEGVFIEKIANGNNRTCLEATLLQKDHCDAVQECTVYEEDFESCNDHSIFGTCVLQRHSSSTGKTVVENPYARFEPKLTDGHVMITLSTQNFPDVGDRHMALECKIKHDTHTYIKMSVFGVHVSGKGDRFPGTFCLVQHDGSPNCQQYNHQEHVILLREEKTTLFIPRAGDNRITHIYITMTAFSKMTMQPVLWDRKAQFNCELNDKTLSDFKEMVHSGSEKSQSETTTARMVTATNARQVPKEDDSVVSVAVPQGTETPTARITTPTYTYQVLKNNESTEAVAGNTDHDNNGWKIFSGVLAACMICLIMYMFFPTKYLKRTCMRPPARSKRTETPERSGNLDDEQLIHRESLV